MKKLKEGEDNKIMVELHVLTDEEIIEAVQLRYFAIKTSPLDEGLRREDYIWRYYKAIAQVQYDADIREVQKEGINVLNNVK